MKKLLPLVLAALTLVVGCKKKDEAKKPEETKAGGDKTKVETPGGGGDKGAAAPVATCPPLKVTVDGAAVEGLTTGLAYTMVNGQYRTEMVDVFNKPVTCADVLAGSRTVGEGEVKFGAFGGPAQGVSTDAYTELSAKTAITTKAGKVGDPMTICVTEVTFSPNAGAFSGKKVTVAGAFTGSYCGDKDMTPKP